MIGISTAALILLTQAPNLTEGFGIVSTSSLQKKTAFSSSTFNVQPRSFVLYATEDQVEGEETAEEVEAEITDDEPKSSGGDDTEDEDKETDENEEPEEDPEVTAIKKEISELESKLKQKNRDLDSLEKLTEQYTRGGYARKVAEMEGFRKSRNDASANNKSTATAVVLQNFLPVLEKLRRCGAQYGNDEFGQKYTALSSDFEKVFADMGVSEFTVSEGDKADARRIVTVEEEYSETVTQGCVIRPLQVGIELDGNVMKMAEAVVSMGPESTVEEATEEAADSED